MKVLAITQARYSSTRLPGKVLLPLGDGVVLDLHLKRIKKSKKITDFVVATTHEPESAQIQNVASKQGFDVFCGDLNDVLDRFYQAAVKIKPDVVVRLTSDCPLIDPIYVDDLIEKFLGASVDYAANCVEPTLPDGMDAEVFNFSALEKAWSLAQKPSEREHVTLFIRNSGLFKVLNVKYQPDLSQYRLTLDTPEDYQVISELVKSCGENASMQEYVRYLDTHQNLKNANSQYERNEGLKKSLLKDSKE